MNNNREKLYTTKLLQALAATIEKALNGDTPREQHTYGFALLTFELHATSPKCNYVSSVERRGMIANLRELLNRLENPQTNREVN